ncbi:thioredoxin family protein [Salinibaculum rarum]|uniref:thioredoxin family protein n=1 Tax=Salinibaculum rarum TaxID=3058903 RepID=UPI003A96B16E
MTHVALTRQWLVVARVTSGDTATDTDSPVALDDEAALEDLLSSHETVLLELYTDGCSICASMEPILTNIARATDAVVATVNPRNDPPLVDRFAVQSVPKFVLFVDGEPVAERAEGFIPNDDLVSWVEDKAA